MYLTQTVTKFFCTMEGSVTKIMHIKLMPFYYIWQLVSKFVRFFFPFNNWEEEEYVIKIFLYLEKYFIVTTYVIIIKIFMKCFKNFICFKKYLYSAIIGLSEKLQINYVNFL